MPIARVGNAEGEIGLITDREAEALLDVLGDEHARAILAATSREPMAAKPLSQQLGVSKATIYRRVDTMIEHGLLRKLTRTPPNGGHVTVYIANLNALRLRLAEGRFDVRVQNGNDGEHVAQRVAARLSEAWDRLPWLD